MKMTYMFRITNENGLHARPAAAFARVASGFVSDVYLSVRGTRVNAKSIMGLLTLAATRDTECVVDIEGPDAENAVSAVRVFVESELGVSVDTP